MLEETERCERIRSAEMWYGGMLHQKDSLQRFVSLQEKMLIQQRQCDMLNCIFPIEPFPCPSDFLIGSYTCMQYCFSTNLGAMRMLYCQGGYHWGKYYQGSESILL